MTSLLFVKAAPAAKSTAHDFCAARPNHGRVCRAAWAVAGLASLVLTGTAQGTPLPAAAPAVSVTAPSTEDALPAIPVMPGLYRLAPDDQLDISVQGHEELHSLVSVLPDGTFHVPIVGVVQAAGMTVDELTRTLRQGFGTQINQPSVTVSVRENHPRKISVLGAAHSTGTFEYKPGWHLLDALAACGGPGQDAGLTSLTLVQASGRKNVPIDLVRLLADGDAAQNPALSPGDILLFQARDPATAEVQVVGQVGHPGVYMVPAGGISLMTLLNAAGGPAPQAALTKAQILHGGEVRVVNLHPLLSSLGGAASGVRLVAGDVLLIPENKLHITVIGEVRSPSLYAIPDGEELPLLKALTVAGGVTSEGESKRVTIIRKKPDGSPLLLTENLSDLTTTRAGDIRLAPDDIVYVPSRHHSKSIGDYLNQLPGIALVANLLRSGI